MALFLKDKLLNTKKSPKRQISFEIIFACLTGLVIAVMFVTGYSYRTNTTAILSLTEDLIAQINSRVIQKTRNYLMTAVDMTELSSRITGKGVQSLSRNPNLDSLMTEVLRLHPQLSMFNIGNQNGDFLQQKRMTDGTIATKIIRRNRRGYAEQTLKERNLNGEVIKITKTKNEQYDPRKRPWYIGAMEAKKLHWSDVYIFSTGNIPGITASSPVRSGDQIQGVFGLDIPLDEISTFLQDLKKELADLDVKSSLVFIVNSKGEVVAYPDPSIPMIQEEGKAPRPRKVEELEDKNVIDSYKVFISRNPSHSGRTSEDKIKSDKFSFESDGVSYIASYVDFPEDFDKDWTVGLIVKEDELIGPIKETNNFMIAISIAILIGAIILGIIMLRLKKALDVRNRFIRDTFGRYLSDDIVETILESPSGSALGGEKRTLTIMMTDLRGFTAIGERLPAESVVKMLNIYLDVMTDIIFKWNGTIDEFIGDAILVIFGAPLSYGDDAQRAIACALEMQMAMDEVNAKNREAGFPEVSMGIGINTGEIVVGNIGSAKRTKYGVVGKHVNLTSRVESYTVGGQTLISESTRDACGSILRIDDEMQVMPKGVNKPITISEVGGIGGTYNIFLPEKKEPVLGKLPKPAKLSFTVLAGKHASDDTLEAEIVEINKTEAIMVSPVAVEKANNIKIQVLNGQEAEIYAKVTKNLQETPDIRFRINFTAIPPENKPMLDAILKQAIL